MAFCERCGSELVENARFCSNCGLEVSFKQKISGWSSKINHKASKTIENLKQSVDEQLTSYLQQFNRGEEVKIGGIKIPENRREGVRNAMESFQNKYLDGNPKEEADYNQWLEDLPKRLEEQNCIVCFGTWNEEDIGEIVVCPHCHSGGHETHLASWIKSRNYCPLCRERVSFTEFIRIT